MALVGRHRMQWNPYLKRRVVVSTLHAVRVLKRKPRRRERFCPPRSDAALANDFQTTAAARRSRLHCGVDCLNFAKNNVGF